MEKDTRLKIKEIIEIVQDRLRKIENEHSVKILYAIESGSRA